MRIVDCIDSIHQFRGEIDYRSFSTDGCMSSEFKFRSAPADKTSYEYIKSKAIYGTRDAAIALSSQAWVAVSGLFGGNNIHHAVDVGQKQEQLEKQNRVFFCNGWNAWSYSGAVRQGYSLPLYNMPSVFVKNFHSGND